MRIIGIVLLSLLIVAPALAQEDQREIITVLEMGEGIFEHDLWQASAAESATSTTATWQTTFESGFSGLSYINYLHFEGGYSVDELDSFFGDSWFEQTFAHWEDVTKTGVCYDGDITLHEFTMSFRDASDNVSQYGVRYWVEPVSETRIRAWHVAIATTYADGRANPDGEALLHDYSARMYPDLSSCPD